MAVLQTLKCLSQYVMDCFSNDTRKQGWRDTLLTRLHMCPSLTQLPYWGHSGAPRNKNETGSQLSTNPHCVGGVTQCNQQEKTTEAA